MFYLGLLSLAFFLSVLRNLFFLFFFSELDNAAVSEAETISQPTSLASSFHIQPPWLFLLLLHQRSHRSIYILLHRGEPCFLLQPPCASLSRSLQLYESVDYSLSFFFLSLFSRETADGEDSSSTSRREEGRNSLKKNNRKAIPAFFKSSSTSTSSSSSSTSSYSSASRGRSHAMSYSTYDGDEDEEEFLGDEEEEESSSFGGGGESGASRALNFFKRKLRHAVTCPAAKILLGLGGIVALGKKKGKIKKKRQIKKKRKTKKKRKIKKNPHTHRRRTCSAQSLFHVFLCLSVLSFFLSLSRNGAIVMGAISFLPLV